MFYLLLLLVTVSVAVAEEPAVDTVAQPAVEVDSKAEETASPIRVHEHHDERYHSFADGLELIHSRTHDHHQQHHGQHDPHRSQHHVEDDHHGPVILRTPFLHRSHEHPDIEKQNRIIQHVYSPDYYQPTWILDYRYMKTGGRDYTRGPGGQILILPKGVHTKEHKEFDNFDSLLEHLRISRIAEIEARRRWHQHEDEHNDGRRGYHHGQEHGHNAHQPQQQHGYYGHNQNSWAQRHH